MIFKKEIEIWTSKYNEMINILNYVEEAVFESEIINGFVTVISKHTTTGITVNESLECLEKDIRVFLEKIVPEDFPYNHARMLKSYGSTAGNAAGHLKLHITGNHCHFIVWDGLLDRGEAQEVYLCEFDGPAKRTFQIFINGDK